MDATDGIELAVLRAERGSKTGPAETLEEIFRAEYPRLVGIVVRVTGDRARADEVVSEAFYKLAQRPGLFRPRNNIQGWLFRTATNLGLNALKADLRRRRHETEAARNAAHSSRSPANALEDLLGTERQRRVREVLASLEPRSAQLLLLQQAGFSYRELALALKINPNSVGQLLLRAAAQFKKEFNRQSEAGNE
jgi:RNA polymerase sigma factor (sigma-70 family)